MELLAALVIILVWAFFVFCPLGAYVWTKRPYGHVIPRNRKRVVFYYVVLVSSAAMWLLVASVRPLLPEPRSAPIAGFFVAVGMVGVAAFLIASLLGPFVADELIRTARRRLSDVCSRCGYNLTGNVSGVCPECGTKTAPAK